MSFEESLAALSLEGTQGECDSLLTTAQGNLPQGWQLLADGSGQDLMLDIFVLIDPCNLCNVACCSRVCRDQLGLLDQQIWRHHLSCKWNRLNKGFPITDNFEIAQQQRGLVSLVQLLQLTRAVPSQLDRHFSDGRGQMQMLSPIGDPQLQCAYVGTADAIGQDRTVRSSFPFPIADHSSLHTRMQTPDVPRKPTCAAASIAYFEVEITDQLPEGSSVVVGQWPGWSPETAMRPQMVSIGLVSERFPSWGSQPGWRPDSFGYHGDDGNAFCGRGTADAAHTGYGPTFGIGDTVGCGIDYGQQSVFFTCNGTKLKPELKLTSMRHPEEALYPCAGIDTCHVIEFNFGAKPFKFDLEGCEEEADLEMGSRSFAEVLQNALWNPMPERPSRPRPRTSMQAVADVLQHLQLNIEHIEQQQQGEGPYQVQDLHQLLADLQSQIQNDASLLSETDSEAAGPHLALSDSNDEELEGEGSYDEFDSDDELDGLSQP